ncbi:hypothetical protein A1O7_03305 [Cladophialophora yegresii CBS 114405]|uniref:Phytanoyl-CoA dioxygenase n=1 Tax=Cladophialophora yegresii CBS 114405 TaxID=1182544 RepID=W9WX92_9EURO|nr:uncharacterized protein A1O7_03305 [Cladophialophora yegresii CBS 114405]EXJ62864.1 hypothetical protein A1O7_03305 [Cladophialophora yegresii CBS 114405]
MSSSTPHLDALRRDGFVKVPNLLPHHVLLAMQASCKYTTDRARRGKWPHVRTVPKQYPPWHEWQAGDNIWGVQHLLHPDMPTRDTFAEVYFGDPVLDVVKELLGLTQDGDDRRRDPDERPEPDDRLVMELFNLLVSPDGARDFELAWHRDDVRPDVSPEEEARQLNLRGDGGPQSQQLHAQYNIALFEDSSLVVVPGSHARVRTRAERDAAPYEPNLPGQVVVALQPGDAVFYDSNILHRGVYRGIDVTRELGRMTLHGSVGLAGHGTERARQVLQHGVGEWVGRAKFSIEGSKGLRAEGMRKRLMEMGSGKDLGYSLVG